MSRVPPLAAAALLAAERHQFRTPPLGNADHLVAFLHRLTDPAAAVLGHVVPAAVPSGLPVGDWAR